MPKVSITILTHNRAALLAQTLESVFSQTYGDYEVLVADDASTDETRAVVQSFQEKDPRIVYLRNQKNIGRLLYRPEVIKTSRGEYIAVLDDDDLWHDPEKLENQVRFLDENPDYVLCGTGALLIDEKGQEIYSALNPETDKEIRNFILARNPFFASSTVFRRSTYEKVGGYDSSLIASEDHDLHLKLGTVGKLYNFPTYSIKYRLQLRNPFRSMSSRAALKLARRYRPYYPRYYGALIKLYARFLYTLLPRPRFLENYLLRLRYTKKLGV